MIESLHLRGIGPAPEMAFEFAPRLNLLTGDNGVGKSFVLDIVWWALTRTWVDHPAYPSTKVKDSSIEYRFRTKGRRLQWVETTFNRRTQTWWVPKGRPPAPGLIIYARLDGGFSVWDPLRNYLRNAPMFDVDDPDRPNAYHFTQGTIWNGLTQGERVLCNGITRDIVNWQLENSDEFKLLQDVLKLLSPSPDETLQLVAPVRMSPDDARRTPALQMPYGIIPLPLASAAVKRVVALAYLLVWSWQEHTAFASRSGAKRTPRIILLVDELEAHIHPKWQRRIMRSLLAAVESLSKSLPVQLVGVTHSPLILASLEPVFDQSQDAIFHLDIQDGTVVVEKPEWRPRGDVGAWLTSEIFDLKEARSLEAEKAIQDARNALIKPDIPLKEIKRIHNDLHAVLKETDPFWPRWLARAEKAGLEL